MKKVRTTSHPDRKKSRVNKVLLFTMLALVTVSIGYTQGPENINLLLCGALVLSPLVLIIKANRIFLPWIDVPFLLVCAWVLTVPAIFHPDTVRITTVLFTCAYCIFFMMFARVARDSGLPRKSLPDFAKIIIYAFFAMLITQQACVLFGWPVINSGCVYPELPWKLNSLSAEPSHTTLTLCFVMFIYTQSIRTISPHIGLWQSLKSEYMLWLCWLWTIFTTYNATAFVLAPMAILPFITGRNIWKYAIAACVVVTAIVLIPRDVYTHIDRIRDFGAAAARLDDRGMIEADGSMASRFVPTIWGAQALKPDTELVTGHGIDADVYDIEDKPCDNHDNMGSAGFFKMTYNYGLPCALFLWIGIGVATLSRRKWWTIVSFLYALHFSADFNMQHLWMIICYALAYKSIVCHEKL